MLSESLENSKFFAPEQVAQGRILRLALGVSLSLVFSQVVNWDISFIAPIVTMVLLATPMPAPGFKQGIGLLILLLLPIFAGIALIPFLYYARWAGIALVAIVLFYSFYFTAKGGSPIVGTFFTIGVSLIVTVGSVSLDLLLVLVKGLSLGVIFGLVFVWIAHALLPDLSFDSSLLPAKSNSVTSKSSGVIVREALRSLVVTFPIALMLLFSSNSPAYFVVMMKTAAMGQQISSSDSRSMGQSLLASTLLGGIGAILAWQWLSIWPNIVPYALIIALAALIFGQYIFNGVSMHRNAGMWSYGLLTMLVILLPAVTDSQIGSTAGESFYSRIFLIVLVAIYGTLSVKLFDGLWPSQEPTSPQLEHSS
ncbi:MAG: DUF2955 domain-containing protein [Pseudomonadales bacterium]|nr:DUF2955 domain-containing protein [Pseudomonadales bacterium]